MDKKFLIIGGGLFLAVVVIFGIIANTPVDSNSQSKTVKNEKTEVLSPAEKIEVLHFHTTKQCWTCITVGQYVLETIKERFSEEYKNGIIVFRDVNGDLPENKELVMKYKAGNLSLLINATVGGEENISEDVTVWRLVSNEVQFKNYFEGKIKKLLGR